MSRRFPAPWKALREESCYVVQDASGRRLLFLHFRPNETVWMMPDHFLTEDEARRIATNIAKLPELLRYPHHS